MEYRAARRLRLRGLAVQLHRDRRQPHDRAGADGQHRDLEAGLDRDAERLLHAQAARGGRACRPASSTSCPATPREITQLAARLARARRHPLHRQHRGLQQHVEEGRREHRPLPRRIRGWSAKPAARTSSSCTRRPIPQEVAVAIARGGFEYQGQKCSAASRVYVPQSLWNDVRDRTIAMMKEIKVGDVARLPQLHGRGHRQEGVHQDQRLPRRREEEREGPVRAATAKGEDGLLHRADAGRDGRSRLPPRCARRSSDRSSPRTSIRTRSGRRRSSIVDRTSPYALTGAVFAAIARRVRAGDERAAQCRRQLLHQRQADRRGRRPAAVRRRARRRAPTTRRARS